MWLVEFLEISPLFSASPPQLLNGPEGFPSSCFNFQHFLCFLLSSFKNSILYLKTCGNEMYQYFFYYCLYGHKDNDQIFGTGYIEVFIK